MRLLLALFVLFSLSACAPPTKQEALDYLGKVRYEICEETLVELDEQWYLVQSYLQDPKKLTIGPNDKEHAAILKSQQAVLSNLRSCLEKLEEVDVLGDEAEYLESLKMYLYTRLRFEEEVVLKFVKKLKNGIDNGEMSFVKLYTGRIMDLTDRQDELALAEEKFLEEFSITDQDLEDLAAKYFGS